MPAMLSNMAGWTARRLVTSDVDEADREPSTGAFRWCARLAALALTVSIAVMVTMVSLDTLAYQCLGQLQCRSKLWVASALEVLAPYGHPGWRLAAGIVPPIAVGILFFFLARISRQRYEQIEPPTKIERPTKEQPPTKGRSDPVPSKRCAAAQRGGLRHSEFWSGLRWHRHLSDLHLAAGIAVSAATLSWCVADLDRSLLRSASVWAEYTTLLSILIVAAVLVVLKADDAHEHLARGLLVSALVALIVAITTAISLPVDFADPGSSGLVPVSAQQPGVLPGIVTSVNVGWGLTLALLVPLILQQTWACASRWRQQQLKSETTGAGAGAMRDRARAKLDVFPWAAPVVLNVVAIGLANAILLSLMLLLAWGLGRVEYGFGPANPDDGASVIWVPKAVMSVASISAVIFTAMPLVLALGTGVWLWIETAKRAKQLASTLPEDYRRSEDLENESGTYPAPAGAAADLRASWIYSAFDDLGSSPVRSPDRGRHEGQETKCGPRPTPWVRKTAVMQLVGSSAPIIAALFVIAVTWLALLGTLTFLIVVIVLHQDPPVALVGPTTFFAALLPFLYGSIVRIAFRKERLRKILMAPFDVGTFFPRSFHPFAPPSYTEKAIPDLTRRIWWLHENGGRVVMTAHSQGSVIAAAVLARQSNRPEEKNKKIGLVTFGSPLAKLYRWAFPALISDDLLRSLAAGNGGIGPVGWCNVYYATDYIGGPVEANWTEKTSMTAEVIDSAGKIDKHLLDPPTRWYLFGQPLPRILSHTGYWLDPRLWNRIDDMCKSISAPLPPPRNRPVSVGTPVTTESAESFSVDGHKGNQNGSRQIIPPDPSTPLPYR
ncbi:hypothetical protein [Arthrobacter sp. B3I4]|uniref:hypothetical protein n=1 Tax=Arthrobacter sp. B3I4 TaxID=3042267 RepID=UPI00278A5618|nr:hypothetical protein [Arthrobacter sp. B3I4]MDQ0756634.1 hypothetical protein [Arthrobacter sp. B3I4]